VLTLTLTPSLDPSMHEAIDKRILSAYPRSSLLEGLMNQRKYHLRLIPSLAAVFGFMERLKNHEFPIQNYTVFQTSSLEQIFLRFVSGSISRHVVMQQEQEIEHLKDELSDVAVIQRRCEDLEGQLRQALNRVRELERENESLRQPTK